MTIIIWFVGSKFYFCLEFIIKNLNKIYFMKKALLALSLVAASTGAFAQISFAPVIGMNLANMTVKNSSGTGLSADNLIGVHAGVFAKVPLNEKLAIMPGLLYSMKGFDLKDLKLKLTVNALEIPLNVSYSITGDNNDGLYIYGGPYLGVALSGKTEDNGITQDLTFNDEDGMQRMDFGGNVGVGYRLPMGLMVQAQYGFGLMDMEKTDNYEYKNKVIGVTIGYFINSKK